MGIQKKEMTCIVCPKGCDLAVQKGPDGEMLIEGNECEKGEKYALEELTSPKRVLTATVAAKGCGLPLLPVRSAGSIPKELLFECMKSLAGVRIGSPVKMGDIIVSDILGTGVDIIAARSLDQVRLNQD